MNSYLFQDFWINLAKVVRSATNWRVTQMLMSSEFILNIFLFVYEQEEVPCFSSECKRENCPPASSLNDAIPDMTGHFLGSLFEGLCVGIVRKPQHIKCHAVNSHNICAFNLDRIYKTLFDLRIDTFPHWGSILCSAATSRQSYVSRTATFLKWQDFLPGLFTYVTLCETSLKIFKCWTCPEP